MFISFIYFNAGYNFIDINTHTSTRQTKIFWMRDNIRISTHFYSIFSNPSAIDVYLSVSLLKIYTVFNRIPEMSSKQRKVILTQVNSSERVSPNSASACKRVGYHQGC